MFGRKRQPRRPGLGVWDHLCHARCPINFSLSQEPKKQLCITEIAVSCLNILSHPIAPIFTLFFCGFTKKKMFGRGMPVARHWESTLLQSVECVQKRAGCLEKLSSTLFFRLDISWLFIFSDISWSNYPISELICAFSLINLNKFLL